MTTRVSLVSALAGRGGLAFRGYIGLNSVPIYRIDISLKSIGKAHEPIEEFIGAFEAIETNLRRI